MAILRRHPVFKLKYCLFLVQQIMHDRFFVDDFDIGKIRQPMSVRFQISF
jgi:hypothetical protein